MRELLSIFLFFLCFVACNNKNEKEVIEFSNPKVNQIRFVPFFEYSDDGYYSIPNKINGKFLLPNYQNYNNSGDTIFIEKVQYIYAKENFYFIIANMMGSKTSLILNLKKNLQSIDVIYAEEMPFIDTIKKEVINDYAFYLLTTHHSDMCSEQEALTIYVLNKELKLSKSFEGLSKEEFNDTGNPVCVPFISYTQNFKLKLNDTDVILIAEKKSDDKKPPELKEYLFKNYQFK